MDDHYKALIKSKRMGDPVNLDVLIELTDWDMMSIKNELKYKHDFFLVSAPIWKFLQTQFGGGIVFILLKLICRS